MLDIGQGVKGCPDIFPGRRDPVWCQHCHFHQWWQKWGIMVSLHLCSEESAALQEESTPWWSEPQERTSAKHSADYPRPAPVPGADCTLSASHLPTGCLRAAMGRYAAHHGTHSPRQLPAVLGTWSDLSPLCNVKLVFEAGTGLHKVLADIQARGTCLVFSVVRWPESPSRNWFHSYMTSNSQWF